jgi:hypothetical protein
LAQKSKKLDNYVLFFWMENTPEAAFCCLEIQLHSLRLQRYCQMLCANFLLGNAPLMVSSFQILGGE